MSIHPIERLWRNVGLPECFLGNGGTNHGLYKLYDAIVQSERDAAPAPNFEAGKSYRTRNGRLMKITTLTPDTLTGTEQNPDPTDRHVIVYDVDGKSKSTGWRLFDLLPGAIEDEKAEAVDPICVLLGQLDTLQQAIIQLQADAISRNDRELNAALEQMDEQPEPPPDEKPKAFGSTPEPVEDREYRSDLRQIHSRLNRQAERFEELSMKLADAMDSGKAQNEDIRRQLINIRSAARGTEVRIDKELTKRICELENYTGLDVRSANRQAAERDLTGLRKSMLDQIATKPTATVVDSAAWTGRPTPPKPTIKGGWVNVYRREDDPDRTWVTSYPYPSREKADEQSMSLRIACIQIPDIQEGEGL